MKIWLFSKSDKIMFLKQSSVYIKKRICAQSQIIHIFLADIQMYFTQVSALFWVSFIPTMHTYSNYNIWLLYLIFLGGEQIFTYHGNTAHFSK